MCMQSRASLGSEMTRLSGSGPISSVAAEWLLDRHDDMRLRAIYVVHGISPSPARLPLAFLIVVVAVYRYPPSRQLVQPSSATGSSDPMLPRKDPWHG